MNARFSLNAANARWGSLYDALYGTDMISEDDGADRGGAYNPVRGDKVIDFSKNFLNDYLPLTEGKYQDVVSFQISNGNLEISLSDQSKTSLEKTLTSFKLAVCTRKSLDSDKSIILSLVFAPTSPSL